MTTLQDRNKWLSRSQRRPIAAAAAADLMVCFPTRKPIMRLMPKPISSPNRATDGIMKHDRAQRPMFKTKIKPASSSGSSSSNKEAELAEPASPKVTCAGQVRVGPRSRASKSWQSVMQEIEWLHTSKKRSLKMGFKKEVMHFLAALRSLRLDFRCFGAVPMVSSSSSSSSSCSDDDDSEEVDDKESVDDQIGDPRVAFSRWSTIMKGNTSTNPLFFEEPKNKSKSQNEEDKREEDNDLPAVPPKNALLLMRCRSAPGWLKRNEDEEEQEKTKGAKEENASFVLTRYAPDFFKISTDIAKETWVSKSDYNLHRSRTVRR